LTAPIAIRQEKLRVLVVESYPRWEYRYLRNALSRDPGVELSCLLFHPGLSKSGGGNKDYIKQFPAGLDELSQFDVVFLAEVWVGLPGFQWYAPVLRAKAGSEVLCVHKDASNDYGRLPLLVTRTFGAGKVLFMGTDGAWRWRKGVEDKYHYRFWGQVVRWMAYQRNMAKGETMRLYYSPEQPQAGQTVVLKCNVMETSGEPVAGGDVTARITAPSG